MNEPTGKEIGMRISCQRDALVAYGGSNQCMLVSDSRGFADQGLLTQTYPGSTLVPPEL
jgi:hypothetical protein